MNTYPVTYVQGARFVLEGVDIRLSSGLSHFILVQNNALSDFALPQETPFSKQLLIVSENGVCLSGRCF